MRLALSLEEVGSYLTEPDPAEIVRSVSTGITLVVVVAAAIMIMYVLIVTHLSGTDSKQRQSIRKNFLLFSILSGFCWWIFLLVMYLVIKVHWEWISGPLLLILLTPVFLQCGKNIRRTGILPNTAKKLQILMALVIPLYAVFMLLAFLVMNAISANGLF